MKILVAEDESALSNALKIKFEQSGFKVDIAKNGAEALEKLEKEKYELLLLDLIMPGTNGFEVLEKIHSDKKDIKIIVTSNLSQEEDKIKAEALGAVDYFVKADVSIQEIVDKVTQLVK